MYQFDSSIARSNLKGFSRRETRSRVVTLPINPTSTQISFSHMKAGRFELIRVDGKVYIQFYFDDILQASVDMTVVGTLHEADFIQALSLVHYDGRPPKIRELLRLALQRLPAGDTIHTRR